MFPFSRRPGQFTLFFTVSLTAVMLIGCASGAVTTAAPSATPTVATLPPSRGPDEPTASAPPATPTFILGSATSELTAASTPLAGVEIKIVEPPFKPPQSWTYDPVTVTVKLGTKIMWTNTGAVLHTVDSDDNQTFKSGDLQPQAQFTFTATHTGTFTYHCHYHPWMKGTFIVHP